MSYPRYPAYKESGVPWLGPVPEHWEVRSLRRVVDVRPSNVDKLTVEGQRQVRLCNYVDVYKNERITDSLAFMVASASDEQIGRLTLQRGDVIITKDSETPDDIGVAALVSQEFEEVVCGYHLTLLRPQIDVVWGPYLFRSLQSSFSRAQFSAYAVGMTRYGLSLGDIKSIVVPVPPPDEQRAIAAFLDRETAQIDALIARLEALVALLQEKRQALISHAVTKGLDPSVPMKDSGVEWLGEIPAHWELERNKWLFREIDERSESGDEELLSVSHITGVTPRSEKTVYMFMAESLEGYKVCQLGDLIINTMWAYMGALGTSPLPGVVSPSYNVYRPMDGHRVDAEYLDYLYRTPRHVVEIKRNSRGVWESRLRLYPDEFFDMATPVPPIAEQEQMVRYLDEQGAQAVKTQNKCFQEMDTLRERRAALITAAVTGQIDVRGLI